MSESMSPSQNQNPNHKDSEEVARAWLATIPDEAKTLTMAEFESWVVSNTASLPHEIRSMPPSQLYEALTQNSMAIVPTQVFISPFGNCLLLCLFCIWSCELYTFGFRKMQLLLSRFKCMWFGRGIKLIKCAFPLNLEPNSWGWGIDMLFLCFFLNEGKTRM